MSAEQPWLRVRKGNRGRRKGRSNAQKKIGLSWDSGVSSASCVKKKNGKHPGENSMKAPVLLFLSAVLASCAIDDGMPNFERMSVEELAAYNEGRNLSQMIICQEATTTTSRVRRKRCATVEALYGTGITDQQL